MKTISGWLLVGVAVASPAWAVSLATTGPAQPLPDQGVATVSLPIAENLVAGSASLVPLMAADLGEPGSERDRYERPDGWRRYRQAH